MSLDEKPLAAFSASDLVRGETLLQRFILSLVLDRPRQLRPRVASRAPRAATVTTGEPAPPSEPPER